MAMERRCSLLVSEGEGTHAALESAERARKALEIELQESGEKYSDLNNQVLHSASASVSLILTGPTYTHRLPDVCPVPVGSQREEEAGGGSPDCAAGARGAPGRDERMHRQS